MRAAKRIVPVDTGALQASIRPLGEGMVGSDLDYAGIVEERTSHLEEVLKDASNEIRREWSRR